MVEEVLQKAVDPIFPPPPGATAPAPLNRFERVVTTAPTRDGFARTAPAAASRVPALPSHAPRAHTSRPRAHAISRPELRLPRLAVEDEAEEERARREAARQAQARLEQERLVEKARGAAQRRALERQQQARAQAASEAEERERRSAQLEHLKMQTVEQARLPPPRRRTHPMGTDPRHAWLTEPPMVFLLLATRQASLERKRREERRQRLALASEARPDVAESTELAKVERDVESLPAARERQLQEVRRRPVQSPAALPPRPHSVLACPWLVGVMDWQMQAKLASKRQARERAQFAALLSREQGRALMAAYGCLPIVKKHSSNSTLLQGVLPRLRPACASSR